MSTGSAEELRTRLQHIDPYEFEDFVAELWEEEGWETEVSSDANDKGVDIVAERDGAISQEVVIQAKRYSDGNKVGRPALQQYYSLRDQEGADAVVVVTTSEFAETAEEWAEEHNVKLVNGDDLVGMIHEHGRHDLVEEYAPRLDDTDSDEATEEPEPSDTTSGQKGSGKGAAVAFGTLIQTAALALFLFPSIVPEISQDVAMFAFIGTWALLPVFTLLDTIGLHRNDADPRIPNRIKWPVMTLMPVLGPWWYLINREMSG